MPEHRRRHQPKQLDVRRRKVDVGSGQSRQLAAGRRLRATQSQEAGPPNGHSAVTSPAVRAHPASERVVRRTKGEIRGAILVKLDVADGTPVESVAEFVYHVSTTT